MNKASNLPYFGQSAVIATKHNKDQYIRSILRDSLGWSLAINQSINTDELGTFSAEKPRSLSPLDCAIKKASLSLQATNADIGLGSEGSFAPDPWGVMTINHENIACVDATGNLLAIGQASQPVNIDVVNIPLPEHDSAPDIAHYFKHLPDGQASIVSVFDDQQKLLSVSKGLLGRDTIVAQIQTFSTHPHAQVIELTYDLRAMHCPQRQHTIQQAAQDLVSRLSQLCPVCQAANFVAEIPTKGLPCETCGAPTSLPKAMTARCQHCGHEESVPVPEHSAPTVHCNWCNP